MPPTDFDPTASWPGARPPPMQVPTQSDFIRLESKLGDRIDRVHEHVTDRLDSIAQALQQLIVVAERQAHAAILHEQLRERVVAVESKASATDAELKRWISYGIGAWAIASTAFLAWTKLS